MPAKKKSTSKPKQKPKTKKKTETKAMNEPVRCTQPDRTEVTMERVKNGYTVSAYDSDYNRKTFIAKTKAEAKKQAQKLLNI